MNHNNSGIYKITNIINNHCYIGSAVNIQKRWTCHLSKLNKNEHHSQHLQSAWNKYTKDKFKFEVLFYCDKKDLIFYEQRTIDTYKPEYNICLTAGSTLGFHHSVETKQKVSMAHKNKKDSKETKLKKSIARIGNKNPNFGKKMSETLKQKLAILNKNRIITEETRGKLQKASKGNSYALGNILSDETKGKMSDSRKGETNGRATITWEIVDSMRELYNTSDISKLKISKLYGVSYDIVINVLNNKTWIK